MFIISCHADTGFDVHRCSRIDNTFTGMMDNYSGVYAVMRAFFSGRITQDYVRIELTYGEEDDFEGAYEVLETLRDQDVVIVVDVTGTPTQKDFVIEKCRCTSMHSWLIEALSHHSFDIYTDCPDPVSDSDEVDVYSEKLQRVCFLGVPCRGGDYNENETSVSEGSIDAISNALCDLIECFPEYCTKEGISIF